MTFDDHDLEDASSAADRRAAASGLELADFECQHGRLGPCDDCHPRGEA
jgi:hypothetical protein